MKKYQMKYPNTLHLIKKENGEFIGSFVPYGYQRDLKDKNKFIVDKEADIVVKKIFKMILIRWKD